ncbi:malto-oligosyltrehalose synthase [Acuticoccus sp. M5D2P5]|uniref:malto-oligosyltrehalose synthase n=1 Tax=Acuticoccus kalidii TaxID=2910977 RepID=UPI001F45E5DA|nr:malto-oligosyltrehalose synthase [Acuticoccus kalidii]MCF3936583.1 malto-oligosyltrehalose synthase [Acuticoccus kalidii]
MTASIGATYRLQFRDGVGFEEARAIVPHLARAGITHLYASPLFAATSGSSHGYDVTDHRVLDPVLGEAAAFDRLAASLAEHGIGLLLDIVPNHMAASTENPWWRDVVQHGAESQYANHFDIDWTADKLILPILGKPYGDALADGDIVRRDHPDWGPVLAVPGHDLPLRPGTESIEDVHACHEAQPYRLAHWRIGRDGISFRRFFEVTGLVGVRVEDERVFDDVHRLLERLVEEGTVTAVRVDHVDGLAAPGAYLDRLAARLGVPILVEKILESDEALRPWPVVGTTGYEFMAAMASLFVDGDGLERLAADYAAIADDDVAGLTRRAKREIINRNLAGELERLSGLARLLLARDLSTRDFGPVTIREGLAALAEGMPVYRTYIDGAANAADRKVLATARTVGAKAERLEDPAILDALIGLLIAPADDDFAREFVGRFQQVTGPLMAKAVEDTLFFRHHRLIALNEVGGDLAPHLGSERYLRVADTPGLAATQTHDTKRGEDARARLYALSDPVAVSLWEVVWPQLPQDVSMRWRWAFGQMLFGSAPLGDDPAFPDRFAAAALKTVREAMEETSWTRTDAAFEARVEAVARQMAESHGELLAPLSEVTRAGAVLGLSQALLKATARPAPDIYQGTFDWDFSMVDPDNRRPVDFTAEAALCEAARTADTRSLTTDWTDGRIKARVLLEALAARAERPDLFAGGRIEAVPFVGGEGGNPLLAFARVHERDVALMVVPARPFQQLGSGALTLREETIAHLALDIGMPLRNRITGEAIDAGPLALGPHLSAFPVLFATSW